MFQNDLSTDNKYQHFCTYAYSIPIRLLIISLEKISYRKHQIMYKYLASVQAFPNSFSENFVLHSISDCHHKYSFADLITSPAPKHKHQNEKKKKKNHIRQEMYDNNTMQIIIATHSEKKKELKWEVNLPSQPRIYEIHFVTS